MHYTNAKWAKSQRLTFELSGRQRAMPLALRLSEGLGVMLRARYLLRRRNLFHEYSQFGEGD